jgi:hypothetical protein
MDGVDTSLFNAYGWYDADPRVNGPDDWEAFRDAVRPLLLNERCAFCNQPAIGFYQDDLTPVCTRCIVTANRPTEGDVE